MKVRKLTTVIADTNGKKIADFRATINSLIEAVETLAKENEKLKIEINFLKITK